MSENERFAPGGYGRQPGQYISTTTTGATESTLPVRQALILARSLFVAQLYLLVIVVLLWLALGLKAIPLVGEILVIACGVIWARLNRRHAIETGAETYDITAPAWTVVIVTAVGLVTWPFAVDFIINTMGLMAVAIALTIYFAPSVIFPCYVLSWRMTAEVADSNYPAPKGIITYPWPVFPWSDPWRIREWGLPDSPGGDDAEREEIMGLLQQAIESNKPRVEIVPRPVPIYNHANGAPNPNAPKLPTVATNTPPIESFVSPGGVTCLWSELVEMVWSGLDIGITTPTWERRTGWGKPYIEALQATLRQQGLAEYNGKGSYNRLTITTKAQAAGAVSRLHCALYPEQYPPPLPQMQPSEAGSTAISEGRKV